MSQDLAGAQPDLPSQPDIPAPELPSPALMFSAGMHLPEQQSPLLAGGGGLEAQQLHAQQLLQQQQQQEAAGEGGGRGSKATRRGPMDEMRQLVRAVPGLCDLRASPSPSPRDCQEVSWGRQVFG